RSPPASRRLLGSEDESIRFVTSVVPAAVPLLRHSSAPFATLKPAMKRVSFRTAISSGLTLATRCVPRTVPSLRHKEDWVVPGPRKYNRLRYAARRPPSPLMPGDSYSLSAPPGVPSVRHKA